MNLDELFRQTARKQPDRPAILGPRPHDALTYAGLDAAIGEVAAGLARAGLRRGNTVGLHCRSGADYIVLNYGVWRAGGCVAPIPPELSEDEKRELCGSIALDFIVTEERTRGSLAGLHAGDPVALSATGLSAGASLLRAEKFREHPPGFAALDAAFIRFTSGTTAASKGVVLSHRSIRERIEAANEVMRIGPADRVVWLLSMSYHFAVSIVNYLASGAAIVLPPNHFADAVLAAAQRHEGTVIYGTPAHYAWMAGSRGAAPLPSLRLALATTTALDEQTAADFRRTFGLPLAQALGIIEIGLPCINVDFAADRCDAVGRVLPAYRLRLEDVGLGPRHREVLLSGPGMLDAYYDPWRTRDEIVPDGWFHTGDVGELDGDGCLYLRGRVKDVISVMGMKFFPQEVERVLMTHPQVAAASVFARADDRLGEVPVARIVPRDTGAPPTPEELTEYCRRRVAAYKAPQGFEYVAALPRTGSGKVLHRDVVQKPEGSRATP